MRVRSDRKMQPLNDLGTAVRRQEWSRSIFGSSLDAL